MMNAAIRHRSGHSRRHVIDQPRNLFLTIDADETLQGDVILPVQYAALHRAAELSPEHRLWMAVLEEAIRCVQGMGCSMDTTHHISNKYHRKVAREEALTWFRDLKSEHVGSLISICGLVHLDARRVSEQVLAGKLPAQRIPGRPRAPLAHKVTLTTREWESIEGTPRRRNGKARKGKL